MVRSFGKKKANGDEMRIKSFPAFSSFLCVCLLFTAHVSDFHSFFFQVSPYSSEASSKRPGESDLRIKKSWFPRC